MYNSAGERGRISVSEARSRIASLVAAGWRVVGPDGPDVTPEMRASFRRSKVELDREVRQMLASGR
jgi:hypothetical protein